MKCVDCKAKAEVAFRTGSRSSPRCKECARNFLRAEPKGEWVKTKPCRNCGTPLYVVRWIDEIARTKKGHQSSYHGKNYGDPDRYTGCSRRCNDEWRLQQRKAIRLKARSGRKCAVCHKPFKSTRSDQKTCSNACRQQLYRNSNQARPREKAA
jgi:predicted nucleic acid-binding Zn ribbon protein